MFPCEWTRIAHGRWVIVARFLCRLLCSLYCILCSLFSFLCSVSVPSLLRFIILSFLPKWKLMSVGKCFWQCARRRQHTEDSKLNVICQVASFALPLWLCLCVCWRQHALMCVSVCVWMCVRHFVFCFISFPTAVCLCPVLQVHFSCQATVSRPSPAPPLSPLCSLSSFWLSPSHTYLTRLMCFKFNSFFHVLHTRCHIVFVYFHRVFLTEFFPYRTLLGFLNCVYNR